MTLTATVLGTPDPDGLADFYHALLGWPIGSYEPEWVTLRPGGPGLSFQLEREHARPCWPAGPGEQQMQLHLDFAVDDLEAATAHALAVGAVLARFQPQEHVRVLTDPDGHPFCLFARGSAYSPSRSPSVWR